jgi:glycosyltransferase involved in cell wall biosynthesis
MQKNKEIHITYIGRLEKEKGIEIVIDSIKRGIIEKRNITWHIC